MHPTLRKDPLFYKKTPPFYTVFTKAPPPFHFLPTGLVGAAYLTTSTVTWRYLDHRQLLVEPVTVSHDCLFGLRTMSTPPVIGQQDDSFPSGGGGRARRSGGGASVGPNDASDA